MERIKIHISIHIKVLGDVILKPFRKQHIAFIGAPSQDLWRITQLKQFGQCKCASNLCIVLILLIPNKITQRLSDDR